MRIPARFNLGDLVAMPLPDEASPDYQAGFLPNAGVPATALPVSTFIPAIPETMVPTIPMDLASNFWTTFSQRNTVPGYTQGVPLTDQSVFAGPYFVPNLPNGGAPYSPGRAGVPQNAFARSPILPDSVLPPTLKRQSEILNDIERLFTRNGWDNAIARESALWNWIRGHGGLKSCCRIPELGAPIYATPPFLEMPSNGIINREIFSQPIGSIPFTGVDTLIGQWQVPKGYDGAITHFLCFFTGNGFDDGSGNIVWRLQIGQRFAKNLGNVTFTYGDLKTALLVPGQSIRLISGQTVSIFANIPSTSPITGGRVFGGTLGWTYPRR